MRYTYAFLMAVAVTFILPGNSIAQKKDEKKNSVSSTDTKAAPKVTVASKIKSSKKFEGLFTLYQDTITGNVMMLIKPGQIGKEYIYFSYAENGLAGLGLFKGSYRSNDVFKLKKYFDRIEFAVQNTNFYFDPKNPISKAASTNFSESVFLSEKVIAEEGGSYLIEANGLLLGDKMDPIKPFPNPGIPSGATFSLGNLSSGKSKYNKIRSYPNNTDIVVELVYDNPTPTNFGGKDVTDARYVSITLQHSFIEVPQNDFKPRFDDPRVGYFSQEVDDKTTYDAIAFRDVINRWHLRKKDSLAKVSEPVEPIVWWIENTTPMEYRDIVIEAGLKWNEAFEKAGFKNAIVMKIQPDTAEWDAGDIRYNVIRWTSSPNPPFGAYGPSFVNPRTGQILGADIMVEYSSVQGISRMADLLSMSSNTEAENFVQSHDPKVCSLMSMMQMNNTFGKAALEVFNLSKEKKKEYIDQFMYFLILHEMGHTLGLNHNMKASQMLMPNELNNTAITRKIGLYGSVMDYPAPNVSLDPAKQGDFYTTKPGPYDMWAVQYGYTQTANEIDDKKVLGEILMHSTDPKHTFGNDADDMRAPGKAIDPLVNVNDMSGDAVAYAVDRFKLVDNMMGKLLSKFSKTDRSYQELLGNFFALNGQRYAMGAVVSRYIGGVHIDRSFAGQNSLAKPFTPVSMEKQKQAMTILNTYMFAPNAYNTFGTLYAYLQAQRRGFNFFSSTEDPKIHSLVLNQQRSVLAHLLHPAVMMRLTDSKLYGNQYSTVAMLNDLSNSVFAADMKGNVNSFRQNLQTEYVNRLMNIADNSPFNGYDNISKSSALNELRKIKSQLILAASTNEETKSHRSNIIFQINKALAVK